MEEFATDFKLIKKCSKRKRNQSLISKGLFWMGERQFLTLFFNQISRERTYKLWIITHKTVKITVMMAYKCKEWAWYCSFFQAK